MDRRLLICLASPILATLTISGLGCASGGTSKITPGPSGPDASRQLVTEADTANLLAKLTAALQANTQITDSALAKLNAVVETNASLSAKGVEYNSVFPAGVAVYLAFDNFLRLIFLAVLVRYAHKESMQWITTHSSR